MQNVIWQDTFDGGSDHRIALLRMTTQTQKRLDMDPDFKWIWTHDPSFRVRDISTHALDPTATCMLGTPKDYPLI
jgi:hypothetical protein